MTVASTIDSFISVAASQLGYYVRPGGVTKYGSWYGIPTGSWCAMFVSWCADRAGLQSVIPKHAWTPAGADWFKARGQWHAGKAGIRRGDIVYYDFPDNVRRIQHVGIVESVNSDGSFNTIEGNTSGTGSQSSGGALMRKRRSSYVVGYGRPNYANVVGQGKDYLELGDQGEDVRQLQNLLAAAGFGVGPDGADGVFGPATDNAVREFQRANGLVADGVYGKDTRAKMQPTVAPAGPAVPPAPAFHGTPGVHTGRLTSDGNFELVVDGSLGSGTISRWQQVMGTPIDGVIDLENSSLIRADQRFLNSVVDRTHIRNLTGKYSLVEDGTDGRKTSIVRQFWMRNAVHRNHQVGLLGHLLAFDGVFGVESVKVLQYALNHATAGTARYGQIPA